MARWILAVALTLFCVSQATAQRGRPVQPDLALRAPATFKTNECIVTIQLASGSSRPSGETNVLIDGRDRMTLRILPRMTPSSSITFVPKSSLCDGKTHKVELTWKGGNATYETVFPSLSARLTPLPTLPPSKGN